jgi:hypothetical protein
MANPWEEFQAPVTQTPAPQPQPSGNPWEAFSAPTAQQPAAQPSTPPWEEYELQTARSEESTLFGRGQAETVWGELGAGLQSGARQVAATPYALSALALEGFDYLGMTDHSETTKWLMEDALAISTGGAKRGIATVEDMSANPITWARYVAGVTGETVPFILSVMAGGGAPGLLAKFMARKGVDGASRAAILQGMPAQMTGAIATGTAIETGATAQELYQATGQVRPGASVIAGSAKGALEAVFPLMLSRQLGLTGGQAIDLAQRLFTRGGAKQLAQGIAAEAGTEYLQEEVDLTTRAYLDENYGFLSPDANSRRLNALVAGATGGGVIQTGAQLMAGRDPAGPLPAWGDVLGTANDAPLVMGHDVGELPVSDPNDILRTAPIGGPTTVTAANAMEQLQFLAEDPVLARGLYAPVVPGFEPQFGTQEEALNDHQVMGGQGYMRLDPGKVKRGDITVAVQDLPDTVADPRIDYLETSTAQQAQGALLEAVKLRGLAVKARSGIKREEFLQQAQKAYRQAIDLGVRVEPLSDSQVILRDPKQLASMAAEAQSLVSGKSDAGLKETRKLPGGKSFYIFEKGVPEGQQDKGVLGRSIDMEKVNPSDMTALPDADMIRRVLATHQVSRKLDLGRARALGIKFTSNDPVKNQNLLRLFSRLLRGASTTVPFEKLPEPMVDFFMKLVDQGLRLDVTPQTGKFAVLSQLNKGQFVADSQQIESDVQMDAGLARIVKQRGKRSREPRVSPYVAFESDDVANLFFGQLHGNTAQRVLAGEVSVKPALVQLQGESRRQYEMEKSPLANVIRAVAKSLGLQTDYVIEIVLPSTLPNQGVRYVEKNISLPGGKKAEPRSVIQVNPWYYAEPTTGGKALQKPEDTFAIKGGPILRFGDVKQRNLGLPVIWKGQRVTLGDVLQQVKKKGDQYPLLSYDSMTDIPTFVGFMKLNEVRQRFPTAVPINDPLSQQVEDFRKLPDAPAPKYTGRISAIGELAKKLGTPDAKMFVPDQQASEMYADVAVAMSESIVKFEWDRTDATMQEMLRDAWRREMHLTQGTKADTQMAKVLPHPLVDRVVSGRRTRQSNQFAFEEWLVMHTARYMTHGNPKGMLSAVDKFFQKMGRYVKRVIDELWNKANNAIKPYSLDPHKGQPHEVVLRWLQQMELRGVGKQAQQESFLTEGTIKQLQESKVRNQKRFQRLGIDDYVIATPERASARQVRALLKVLPKDAAADRAKLSALIGVADRHSTMMDWLLGLHQMQDMNPHIKGLRDYTSQTRAMENVAISWATMADERLREAMKLGKAQTLALNNLLFDLDQMVYLDQEKLAKGEIKPRWPRPQELMDLVRKHSVSREAFNVYVEMRNDFLQFLSYLEVVSVQQARETISDPALLQEKVNEIVGETAQIKSRPYFPHMRFGQYSLVVKGAKDKTLFFAAYQSKKARDIGARALEEQFANDLKEGKVRITENEMSPTAQQYQGLPGYALQNVIRRLGLDEDNALLSSQQRKDKAALEAMAVQALPTESLRKHLAGRKNVPGWSADSLRAYANYFGRAARFMARVEFGQRLEQSIKDVRDSGSPLTRDKRTRIADFMQQHFEAQMEPAADWAELRALGFLWYFAFVPSAALINSFQVPMVTMPFLASKFGDLKTMGRVTQAYADATKELFSWLRGDAVADTVKQEAIEEAHHSRLIDDGYAAELSALSQGPVLQATIPGTAFARGLRRFAQWGTLPFQLMERMNRSVTFRATYELALRDNANPWIDEVMLANKPEADALRIDRGWDERHVRAYMAAADAIRKSQFEYGRWARPKLMEGPRGVLLMFKTYLQNMLYFMFKQERGVQARWFLLMLFVAGVMGMPGAEDAAELAKWLARQMGIRFNFEHTLRELMVGWGAGEYADIALHGASREGFGIPAAMNGLGIPAPTLDLSASLSMGRIIPGLKPLLNPAGISSQNAVGEVVSEIAGPVFGVPFDMYQSLMDKQLAAEDPKRWENALPRALKSVSKASRYLAEERERDRTGATVVKWDPNDLNDQLDVLLGVGLGFQPTKLRQTWDYLSAQKEAQDYWKGQRQVLMSEVYRAHRLKDKEGKRDAIQAIKRFNAEAPDRALKITGEAIRQSIQTRARNLRMKEKDVPREKYLRGVAKGVEGLYPEVVQQRRIGVNHQKASP